jgi:hypothetical protein
MRKHIQFEVIKKHGDEQSDQRKRRLPNHHRGFRLAILILDPISTGRINHYHTDGEQYQIRD